METQSEEVRRGSAKGVLIVLGLCLLLGALVTYLQGQWSGTPSNSPDCSDDIVIEYSPKVPGAPRSIFVDYLATTFEIPRDGLLFWKGPVGKDVDAGGSVKIKYNEVICERDVSTLALGASGEQALRFDVQSGGGSPEVKTRQDEGGPWHFVIESPPASPGR